MSDYYCEVAKPDGYAEYFAINAPTREIAQKLYNQEMQRLRGTPVFFLTFGEYVANPFRGLNKRIAGIKIYV